MDTFQVTWAPPDISIDTGIKEFAGKYKHTNVPVNPLFEKTRDAILRYREGHVFPFSFFDEFGIPPYAYIDGNFWQTMLYTREPPPFSNEPPVAISVRDHILEELFSPNADLLGSPMMATMPTGAYFHHIYRPELEMFPGADINKVHLYVKHDSILYAVCKLTELQASYPDNRFIFKYCIFNRLSHLLPGGNSGIRSIVNDGGPIGTVVIYGMSDPAGMTELIRRVLALFPNHDEIGLMDLRGRDTISAFHVRLNRLISYGATDRGNSLTQFEREVKEGIAKPRPLPPWLYDMQRKEEEEGWEEVNRKSQYYLGIDLCYEDSLMGYDLMCGGALRPSDLICFLPSTLLDPRTLVEVPPPAVVMGGVGGSSGLSRKNRMRKRGLERRSRRVKTTRRSRFRTKQ